LGKKLKKGGKMKKFLILSLSILMVSLAFSQIRETGVVQGNVYDTSGTPLPGVSVTLAGPKLIGGARTTVTDANGFYRFPSVPVGSDYTVTAELQGFVTVKKEQITVHANATAVVDFTLETAKLAEEVTVVATPPVVDPKTSAPAANVVVTTELLRNIPNTQFMTNIINLAPGVTPGSYAFGGAGSSANAYQVDGVDVSDPEGGTPWVFMDYQVIQEAQVLGVGLPAEYGAFTGGILNTVTKSGGNVIETYNEFLYQDKEWISDNLGKFREDELYNPNPSLIKDIKGYYKSKFGLFDLNLHLGGPFIKDKLWFFAGAQFYRSQNFPSGFHDPTGRGVRYNQPRGFFKLTYQLNENNRFQGFLEHDQYCGVNRRASYNVAQEATVTQISPEWVFNFNFTHIFSPKTFLDLKVGGYWGYYYLEPESGRDAIAYYNEYGYNTGNSPWWYMANRVRTQVNAHLSHYADNFIKGSHDFKFGVEIEKDWNQSLYGYTGAGDSRTGLPKSAWIYTYGGEPYLAYQWEGYDQHVSLSRYTLFAQDSWTVSKRLTINAGVRYDIFRGAIVDTMEPFSSLFPKSEKYWLEPAPGKPKELGTVYKPTGLAPRIGFTFDLFGDRKTVLKAHYGHYYEAIFAATIMQMDPRYKDYHIYYWTGSKWVLDATDPLSENKFRMDPDIKHPYMEEITAGIEREIFKNASIGITFIQRNYKNMIGPVTTGTFVAKTGTDPLTGKTFTAWNQIDYGKQLYIITNPKAGKWTVTIDGVPYNLQTLLDKDPYRKYQAVEILFNKRFSNKWQLLFAYLYTKTKSNADTSWGVNTGATSMYQDLNYQIFSDGVPTIDPTHQIKIQGSWILPRFGILPFDLQLNAYYFYQTGNTYTRLVRTPSLYQGRKWIFAEPRGSRRVDNYNNLDIRLETQVPLYKGKLGLMLDVFNVFNYAGVRGRYARTGSNFEKITGIDQARSIRLGIRYSF
jgi:outer membrane receptor protein involved in Fe transport